MAEYVLSFRTDPGRQLSVSEQEAWPQWFQQIGDRVADFGHRVVRSQGLGTAEDVGDTLGGYVIVRADDFAASMTIARGCPALTQGGGVEVGELEAS